MIDLNEELVHFIIGSTIFISIFPYVYFYHAFEKLTPQEEEHVMLSFTTIVFACPIVFGLIFAITYRCIEFVPRKYNQLYIRYIVAGTLTSIILSLLGEYFFNIHSEIAQFDDPTYIHLAIGCFYFIWFYTFGIWLRAQLLYGSSAPAPNPTPPPPVSKPSPPPPVSKPTPHDQQALFDQMAKTQQTLKSRDNS